MHRIVMTFLLLVSLDARAARADFVVAGPLPGTEPAPGAPANISSGNQEDTPGPGAPPATNHADAQGPAFRIAKGFGDRVPLGFAIRQIVPPAVRVTYGPGAGPDALVNWRGGEGWNKVLLRAVQPLGLRLVMTATAVEIRK